MSGETLFGTIALDVMQYESRPWPKEVVIYTGPDQIDAIIEWAGDVHTLRRSKKGRLELRSYEWSEVKIGQAIVRDVQTNRIAHPSDLDHGYRPRGELA